MPIILYRFEEPSKKPVNGEVDLPNDHAASNSPSVLENDSKTKTDRVSTHHDAASEEDENDMDNNSKGFDINQFFMSETVLPFSGGVSTHCQTLIKLILYYVITTNQLINPIMIWIYPHKQGWPIFVSEKLKLLLTFVKEKKTQKCIEDLWMLLQIQS